MICPECGQEFPSGGRCSCGYAPQAPSADDPAESSGGEIREIADQLSELRDQLARLTHTSARLQERLDILQRSSRTPLSGDPAKSAQTVSSDQPPSTQPPPTREPAPTVPPSFVRRHQPPLFESVRARVRERSLGTREWELLVGGNWLSKIGILAIFLGSLYFLKYAFDHQWIGNTGRVLIGVFTGLLLLYGGEYFQRKEYRIYGQSLSGGGVAILYLSIYAAANFYSLIPRPAAFGLMALVTLCGGVLAYRHDSRTLAVIGLLGGLLTPYWLRGGENQQVVLLTYLLILDWGFGILGQRKEWTFLNGLSFAGTVILFLGWAVEHYTREALAVTQFFLTAFAATYLVLTEWDQRRTASLFQHKLAMLAVAIYFFSSQAVLSDETTYYWIFLVLFSCLALAYGAGRFSNLVNEFWLLLVGLGIVIWLATSYQTSDRPIALAGSLTLLLLVLSQGIVRQKLAVAEAGRADFRIVVGAGLGWFWAASFLLGDSSQQHPGYQDYLGLLAVVQGIFHLVAARIIQSLTRSGRLLVLGHVACAITLAVLAVPIQLDQHWITIGWAVQAVVLAQIGFSVSWNNLRWTAWLLLVLSLLRLLLLDAWERVDGQWVLLNARGLTFVAVIAAVYLMGWIYHRNAARDQRLLPPRLIVDGVPVVAGLLTVLMFSLEVWWLFNERLADLRLALDRDEISALDFDRLLTENRMGRLLGLSLVWAGYSLVTCVAGILRKRAVLRLFGIALFFVTIVKVFWLDIWALQQFYRIVSVVGLGVFLLMIAFLYQKFRSRILQPADPTETGEAREVKS